MGSRTMAIMTICTAACLTAALIGWDAPWWFVVLGSAAVFLKLLHELRRHESRKTATRE